MKSNSITRSGLLILFIGLLLSATSLRAMMPVVFNLDTCAGYSKAIARGYLNANGNFTAHEFFKGELPSNIAPVQNGAQIYQKLFEVMTNESQPATNYIEVVAFLNRQLNNGWELVDGYAGMAGLAGTNIYLFGYGEQNMFMDGNSTAGRDEHYNRASFLAAIQEEVRLDEQLEALCALPRSAKRVRKLIQFQDEHGGWYRLRRMTESLRPLAADEQVELLNEIEQAKNSTNQCALLNLAANLNLSKDTFEVIEPFMGKDHPPEVRQAAIWALSRIDANKTTQLLLPQMTLQLPELHDALNVLQADDPAMDLKIVDVLLSLSKEMRQREKAHARQEAMRQHQIEQLQKSQTLKDDLLMRGAYPEPPNPPAISWQLQEAMRVQLVKHVHPLLLSFYFNWLSQNQPVSPAYVTAYLQSMLGVRWDAAKLLAWWEQNHKQVMADYPLQKTAGCEQWFTVYQGGDETLQHFLVRLWVMTPATNQLALVKAAKEEKTAVMAKSVITELWTANHLGNEAIQAMFENFMRVEFVDAATNFTSRFKYQHELQIILKFDYPFNTCFYFRTPMIVDGKLSEPSTSEGQLCPEPSLKEYRLGCLGGYVPGKVATGTLEVFHREHYPDGKILWHAHWNLGPIPLGE